MAKLANVKEVTPTRIDKFLGLNLSDTGDTQIQFGESGNMDNFYITNDLKLRKMYGYKSFFDFETAIRGMYSTNLGGTEYLLVAANGKLYYFLKTELDENFLVVPEKERRFTGDGEITTFDLEITDIESVEKVYINTEETTEYTADLANGTITFDTAPEGKIKVEFTKHLQPTLIGDIGPRNASFFTFDKKVYILSGKYQSWDGTTLTEVEGYTPLVFINSAPAGGGVVYDEINMLSPKKHQTFNGDGTSTVFKLAQKNIDSVDRVKVNGSVVPASSYTVNLVNGTVTFNSAPSRAMDNVDIYWSLDDGDRATIENMRFGTVFGGDIDSRVFLYGNPECQNRTHYSGIALDYDVAQPSCEYFPASAFVDVGPSNFALTDLTRQYDRLIATTNRTEAYYMTISTESLPVTLTDNTSTSRLVPAVSTFPLNETHGNVAPGQGQLIDNNPLTLDKHAIIQWKATNVRDERNMEDISIKIKKDLVDDNLAAYKTLDFQSANQLWLGSGNKFYIYNYMNKTYSRIRMYDDLSHFVVLGNHVYMALLNGKIVKWGEEFQTFDGDIIRAHWEMNFSDFGAAYLRKTMTRLWVLMQPQTKSSAYIGFVTNRKESATKKYINYHLSVFDDVDFNNFSFKISNNPQPFRLKLKAKKFTNLKITIDNDEDTDCTILQLALKVESFGESK